jgi:hypothetical protein
MDWGSGGDSHTDEDMEEGEAEELEAAATLAQLYPTPGGALPPGGGPAGPAAHQAPQLVVGAGCIGQPGLHAWAHALLQRQPLPGAPAPARAPAPWVGALTQAGAPLAGAPAPGGSAPPQGGAPPGAALPAPGRWPGCAPQGPAPVTVAMPPVLWCLQEGGRLPEVGLTLKAVQVGVGGVGGVGGGLGFNAALTCTKNKPRPTPSNRTAPITTPQPGLHNNSPQPTPSNRTAPTTTPGHQPGLHNNNPQPTPSNRTAPTTTPGHQPGLHNNSPRPSP